MKTDTHYTHSMSIFVLTFSISLLSRRRLSKNESNETIFFLDYSYVSVTIVVVHLVLYRYLLYILYFYLDWSSVYGFVVFDIFRSVMKKTSCSYTINYNIILSCTMDGKSKNWYEFEQFIFNEIAKKKLWTIVWG